MADIDIAARFRTIVEDGMGRGDESVLEAYLAEDLVEHQRGNPQGLEGAKGIARTLHRWMRDFSLTVEDIAVVSEDKIEQIRNRLASIPPGSVFKMSVLRAGKIVELTGTTE